MKNCCSRAARFKVGEVFQFKQWSGRLWRMHECFGRPDACHAGYWTRFRETFLSSNSAEVGTESRIRSAKKSHLAISTSKCH